MTVGNSSLLLLLFPRYIPANKTLLQKVVTGPEDPKLFTVTTSTTPTHGNNNNNNNTSTSTAVLFSSLPPRALVEGAGTDMSTGECDFSSSAVVQMYTALEREGETDAGTM